MTEKGDIAAAKARYDLARARHIRALAEVKMARKAWLKLKNAPPASATLERILRRFAEAVGPHRPCTGYFSGNDLIVNIKTRNADMVQLETRVAPFPHWSRLSVDQFFLLYLSDPMPEVIARIAEVESGTTIEGEYTEQVCNGDQPVI